jgi:hypothetical protein
MALPSSALQRKTATRSKASGWLRDWRAQLSERNWPDAAALYLMGELDERDMMLIAEGLRPKDGGIAAAEASVFAALERGFAGEWEEGRRRMNEMFHERYSPGYTLALLIWTRSTTPGQTLQIPLTISMSAICDCIDESPKSLRTEIGPSSI